MEALPPETHLSHLSKDGLLRFAKDKPNMGLFDCLDGGPFA